MSPDGASWAQGQGLVHSASLSVEMSGADVLSSVNQVNTGLVHKRAEHHGVKQAYSLGLSMMMEMFFTTSRTVATRDRELLRLKMILLMLQRN